MKVFVDTKFGSMFSLDLDPRNIVFDIKKSIESSQGIPVSMQTLYFNDAELVVDHYQLRVYRIVNNSRLLLLLRADHFNNQMLRQSPYADQGFIPPMATSNYVHMPPSHATESFLNQDLRVIPRRSNQFPQSPYAIEGFVPSMATSNYNHMPPSHASESFLNQDLRMMPRRSNNQVLHQTQISTVPLSHARASFYNQDQRTMMARSNQVPPSHASESFFNQDLRMMPRRINQVHQSPYAIQGYDQVPPSHAGESFFNQDRLVSNDDQVFQTNQPTVPSHTFGDFSFGHDPLFLTEAFTDTQSHWPASTFNVIMNKNQVFQTEYLPVQSNSTEESSNQVFLTEKLTVIMTQYDKPGRKLLVDVKASDNVEELKKDLVTIRQKYQLDLPAKGYFLIHKERVLDDDKSFRMNRVANGDTIEIFPGPDIEDYST